MTGSFRPVRLALGLFVAAVAAGAAAARPRAAAAVDGLLDEAIAELGRQPRTERTVERARTLLRRIADDPVAPEDAVVQARYLLARQLQVHRARPDAAAAAAQFETLWRDHPRHPLAQHGLVRWALIRLYEPASEEDRDRRFAEAAERVSLLDHPAARRELHLILGLTSLRLGRAPEEALRHVMAAESLGLIGAGARADTLVRIGELARASGREAIAREHYGRFLAEFPRDIRRTAIEARLRALGSAAP